MSKLTSRERVERCFKREPHDRIPRHESFWSDTIQRWQGEGLDGNAETVLDMLQSDLQRLNFLWPCPYPGRRDVLEEDDETILFTDRFGQTVRHWKGRSGTPEHHGWECDSSETWHNTIKPALLGTGLQIDLESVKKLHARGMERQAWTHITGVEPFECTRQLMGDETTMIAMATEPEWVQDVAQTHTDVLLKNYQAVLDLGIKPDCLWTYGDMAYRNATMCSPQMYRELVWPQHKRLADFAHSNGMWFIYHTDGDVNGVIDMYLEAGFDGLQPLEAKASMDVRQLVPTWGDKLVWFGNIDVMTMGTNDFEKIEEEIATKFAAGMQTRGYIYHSDHSVPPQVEWKTYQHIIKLVDKYGNYE